MIFRLLVENVKDYAIFLSEPNGNVATWNQGAERIKGYKAHEIIGRHFSQFYPKEARESRWPERELEMAAQQGRFVDEGQRVQKGWILVLGLRGHHSAPRRPRGVAWIFQGDPRSH